MAADPESLAKRNTWAVKNIRSPKNSISGNYINPVIPTSMSRQINNRKEDMYMEAGSIQDGAGCAGLPSQW